MKLEHFKEIWPPKGQETQLVYARTSSRTQDPWDFPGGAVVKTLSFHCRVHVFNPWLGN